MGFWSNSPVQVSETIMSWVGYVTNPQVALDANGLATVIYMGNSLEATRELPDGSWTPYASIIQTYISGASYMSPDLAVDNNGNAVVALSIFDPTVGVDRASVWVTQGDANGNWTQEQRLTDPTVPIDAYATRVAVSPDGALKIVGWIDHYHGTAQVAQLNGTTWNTSTIGRGTAFASFQEVMDLTLVQQSGTRHLEKHGQGRYSNHGCKLQQLIHQVTGDRMKPKFNLLKHTIKTVMVLGIATTTLLAVSSHQALAARYTAQEINSPGPAMRMSNNAQVTGFYVAKCVTLSSQPSAPFATTHRGYSMVSV